MLKSLQSFFKMLLDQVWFKNFINYGIPLLVCGVILVEYTHIRPIQTSTEIYSLDDSEIDVMSRIMNATERVSEDLLSITTSLSRLTKEGRIQGNEQMLGDANRAWQKQLEDLQKSIDKKSGNDCCNPIPYQHYAH